MKNRNFILFPILASLFLIASCSKKDKQPDTQTPEPVIAVSELTDYYIAIKSSNPAFAVILFDKDGSNVKWSCHWLGGLRQANATLKHIDNTAKTAELQIDLDAPGSRSMIFKIVKNAAGDLSIRSSAGEGAVGNINLAVLIKKSSLSGLVLNGSSFQVNQNNNLVYRFLADDNFRFVQSGIVQWTKKYYALSGDVGFKSNDDQHFGVFISDGGNFGFEMRSTDGSTTVAQKMP